MLPAWAEFSLPEQPMGGMWRRMGDTLGKEELRRQEGLSGSWRTERERKLSFLNLLGRVGHAMKWGQAAGLRASGKTKLNQLKAVPLVGQEMQLIQLAGNQRFVLKI